MFVMPSLYKGNINDIIMIKQPPDFEDVNHPQKVCLLRKALYSLKQAPRSWYVKFMNFFINIRFLNNHRDSSLFNLDCNSKQVWILVYVDDLIFISNCIHTVNSIIKLFVLNSNAEILAY